MTVYFRSNFTAKAVKTITILSALTLATPVLAQTQNSLGFLKNYFLTGGDYAVGGVALAGRGVDGVATGAIRLDKPPEWLADPSQAPEDIEVVAALLYWQVVTEDGSDAGALGVSFNGVPLETPDLPALEIDGGPLGKVLNEAGSSPCWSSGGGTGSGGGQKRTYTYRADVLRFLPVNELGRHEFFDRDIEVQIPDSGSTGNATPIALGASLVVVYRDTHPDAPMSSIVFYDGGFAINNSTPILTQTVEGFYDPDPSALSPWGDPVSAKLTLIAGGGQANKSEQLTISPSGVSASNPFVSGWDNVSKEFTPPGVPALYVTVDASSSSGDCLNFGAIIFKTPVNDLDRDGLLDVWETDVTGLVEPNSGDPFPNLPAMGANPNRPDVFFEIGYLKTAGASYGGVSELAHTHLPTPEALRIVAKAFQERGIVVHFDAGDYAANFPAATPDDFLPPCDFGAVEPCMTPPGPGPQGLARGGDWLDESATVCAGIPADAEPWVCQFNDYPGTIGWKSGFRFFRDGPVDPDACAASANPDLEPACEPKFDRNRKDVFRYALFAHSLGIPKNPCLIDNPNDPGDPNNGYPDFDCMDAQADFRTPVTNTGVADFPGGDILVTLGGFRSPDNNLPVGSDFMQASTLVHEFGHTLERGHAGDVVDGNCHPNYLSVMNYLFQLRGLVDGDGVAQVDLSSQKLSDLDETGLVETSPLGPLPYRTAWYAPLDALPFGLDLPAAKRYCNGAPFDPLDPPPPTFRLDATGFQLDVDWNGDGLIETTGNPIPAQDINFDGVDGTLEGSDDWTNLRLDQVGIRRNAGSWYFLFDPDQQKYIAYLGPASLDFGRGDLGRGDLGRGDLGRGDLGRGDLGRGDLGRGDLGRGDLGRGDLGRGDLGRGDLGRGDLGRGDLGRGDLGRGDLGDGSLVDISTDVARDLGNSPPNEVRAATIEDPSLCDGSAPAECHRVQLTWKRPHVGIVDGYLVYRVKDSLVSGNPVVRLTDEPLGPGINSLVDTDELPDATTYVYYVRATFDDDSSSGLSNPALIRPDDQSRNDPPLAESDAYETGLGTLLVVSAEEGVLANDSDYDSAALDALLVQGSGPSHGVLTFNSDDGSFTYQPDPWFVGDDKFRYLSISENDPDNEDTPEVEVTITVTGYSVATVANLSPGTAIKSGRSVSIEWQFTLDGQSVDSSGAMPRIIVRDTNGNLVLNAAQSSSTDFRISNQQQGWVWSYKWRTVDSSGNPLPTNVPYVVSIVSDRTGQVFDGASAGWKVTLK